MLHSIPHLGPKGISRILSELPPSLPDELIELDRLDIWTLPEKPLKQRFALHDGAINCLISQKNELISKSKEIADSAEKMGIRVITILDPDYPPSLRDYYPAPPPIIYTYGNLSLFRERKFAVIGSSSANVQSLEVIREITGSLTTEGLSVVTSHNTNPYQAVGLAARSKGGSVALVLDRGILSAFPNGLGYEPIAQSRIWDLHFDPEKDLVVSPFRLYDRWIGANGRERDRMVFSLADVIVAVDIRSGGVMEKECSHAHEKGREVYVYNPGEGNIPLGNQHLLDIGCHPIIPSSASSFLATLDLNSDDDINLGETGVLE